MAEMALEQTLDLGDYLSAFRRRRGLIALVAGVVFTLGLITAFVWPPTYESTSTILIEAQEVPDELIQSTVTSFAAQRIQLISQRVMTRTNLVEIMDKYGLYESERRRQTIEEVLEDMREDILVDMITAEVVDPRSGRPAVATIAFTVGFQSESPELAQKVAGELTTLYLSANLKTRTEGAAETSDFLTVESKRLMKEIKHFETTMTEFKERHMKTLPEVRDINEAALARAEQQISSIDTQLQSLGERKIYVEGQLPLLDPYVAGTGTIMSPEARLEAIQTEFISLASRYSPDHPDVIRVKREIRSLEKETGVQASQVDLITQMGELLSELRTAEELYTQEHPDVRNLKRQIAALENEIRNTPASEAPVTTERNPDNPSYVNLMTQLAAIKSEISSFTQRRAELVDKVAGYEERLLRTPKTEQDLRAIVHELEELYSRYDSAKRKQSTAEIAQSMEKERKGEKFTLIDPAALPEEPISPNRPAIIFLSLVLALGAGVGSAAVAESTGSVVRGSKGLVAILHTAPLAVIPYLPNAAEARAKTWKKMMILFSVVAGIAILLMLVHFLYSPLDVLWLRGLRKLDTIIGE